MNRTSEDIRAWFGLMLPDEVNMLKALASSLPDNPVIVNIGAGRGTSGMAFMESRDDVRLITIDVVNEMLLNGGLESERWEFGKTDFPLPTQEWEQIHEDSVTVGKEWDRGQVDMVFVDGDHSYDGAYGDISSWVPHIKNGGFIAIHDYKRGSVDYKSYVDKGVMGITTNQKDVDGVDNAVRDYFDGSSHIELDVVDSLIVFEVRHEQRKQE